MIFYKDTEGLLFRTIEIEIIRSESKYFLKGSVIGEELDPNRHEQRADVKAVTFHQFKVEENESGWSCFVILDV